MPLLNRSNRIPLYIQLKEEIIEKIEEGKWKPGDAIPTESELQKLYKISRITVRQALGELVSSGTLALIQGKGTFVAEPKLEPIRPALTSFTKDMAEQGNRTSSRVLNFDEVKATDRLKRIFKNPNLDMLQVLERVRLVDGVPVGIHKSYLNLGVLPGINLEKYDLVKGSLYEALRLEGAVMGPAEETIEAGQANAVEADLLDIPAGSPVLLISRTTYLKSGDVFEYVKMVYRGDKYKYSVKLS